MSSKNKLYLFVFFVVVGSLGIGCSKSSKETGVQPPYYVWHFKSKSPNIHLAAKHAQTGVQPKLQSQYDIQRKSLDTVYPPRGWNTMSYNNDTVAIPPYLTFTPSIAAPGTHSITLTSWTPGSDPSCTPILGVEATITDNVGTYYASIMLPSSLTSPPSPSSFTLPLLTAPGASYFIITPLSVLATNPWATVETVNSIVYGTSGYLCTDPCGNSMVITVN